MNKTSDQIAADLRLKRQAFHASVEELQAKLKSVTDWRQQFEQHPVMMIAAAMGAGALLATVAGRAERRRATPPVSAVASDVFGPSQSIERPSARGHCVPGLGAAEGGID